MKALVTGATGGLGRNLAERLHRDGHEVIATGRNREIGGLLTAQGIRFEPVDLADKLRLAELATGVDTVFHCAALSSPWGRYKDFHAANVVGTEHVALAALINKARLVHVSTPSIYFQFFDRLNISEFDPLPPRMVNHYADTKLKAEKIVTSYVAKEGLKAVIIRPRGIFGPYDTVLMPRLIAAAKDGAVPLINGGKAVVDVTYVDNVVHALMLAAKADHIDRGQAYNITNGQGMVLSNLLEMTFAALGLPYRPRTVPYWVAKTAAFLMEFGASLPMVTREPKLTRYTAGVFRFDQTLNIDRARRDLGYEPQVKMEEGIHRYAEWFRSHNDGH
jgi:nucleoside-diphosphate-sugar epimerase